VSEIAYIKVIRKKGFYAMFRNFEILLNGQAAGKIARGQEVVFEVPPGIYTIQNKIDWLITDPLELEVKAGETATFQVSGKAKGGLNQEIFIQREVND